MVNGMVSLALSDVDLMRESVKNALDAQKKAEDALVQVKADKRIMKVREYIHGGYNISIRAHEMMCTLRDYSSERRHSGINWSSEDSYLEQKLKRFVTVTPVDNLMLKQQPTEFINFDDVKAEMRTQMELLYSAELGLLRASVKEHVSQIASLNETHTQKVIDIQKYYQGEIKKLGDKIEQQNKAYAELEAGKKELSKIEALELQLKEVKEALEKEKAKKWHQKLFK